MFSPLLDLHSLTAKRKTSRCAEMEVLEGLLTESVCKRPVQVRTDPIADHYTVEPRPFARGKFATVRRCRQKSSGVEFAAKSMRKRRRASDVRHEILHEAHVLELSASHPHIVQLHEVYETHSEITLVLELVPGGELQRVLDDEEVVPETETARLLRQILSGVTFLHDHKIAHLDLKPQNLLLTKPFPDGEVKLCDFGISRLITKGIEIREIVGTPDYVAPEVLHYEPISLATDMWSIGILTYVLLSGHSPFGGDTKQETFCNITQGALEFPADLFGGVSNNAKDFIQRLLVRNPRERMTSEESLSHPWLCTTIDQPQKLTGVELTLISCDDTVKQDPVPPFPREDNLNMFNRIKINSVSEPVNGSDSPNLLCKSPSPKDKSNIASFCHGSPSLKRSVLGDSSTNSVAFLINNQNGTALSNEHTNGNTYFSGPTHNSVCHPKEHSGCSMLCKSPLQKDTSVLMEQTNGNIFHKSLSQNGPSDLMDRSNTFCKSSLQKGTSDLKEQNTTSTQSVVAQFEGISVSKRVVYSEEIIVEERVGMVY